MNLMHFHRPETVAAAAALAAEHGEDKLLAGGQSLLPTMRMGLASPHGLIDLSGVAEMRGVCRDGDGLVIGAMATHAEVAANAEVKAMIPALADLAGKIGDRQVRNRGTIGGSIAHNDPAACYPAAVLGLDATIRTNRRRIAAADYFRGLYSTALDPDELIVAIHFPRPEKAAWVKFRQPASRFSIVGVFLAKTAAGVRVAVTGAGVDGVFRATAIEQALDRSFTPAAAEAVVVDAAGLSSDLFASADYRAHLIPVLAARAVVAAT